MVRKRKKGVQNTRDILGFNHSKDELGLLSGKLPRPVSSQSLGGGGIVSDVEDESLTICIMVRSPFQPFKAARPAGGAKTGLYGFVTKDDASSMEGFHCEGGVILLVFTWQGQSIAEEGVFKELERSPALIGYLFDDPPDLGMLHGREDRFPGHNNGGFFHGDICQGVPKPLLMIQRDGCQDCHIRRDGGGGVEAPTHSRLEDDEFAGPLREIPHGDGKGQFKKGRVVFPFRDEVSQGGEMGGNLVLGDLEPRDPDTLAVVDEVRRGEQSGSGSGRPGDRLHERAG